MHRESSFSAATAAVWSRFAWLAATRSSRVVAAADENVVGAAAAAGVQGLCPRACKSAVIESCWPSEEEEEPVDGAGGSADDGPADVLAAAVHVVVISRL